MTGLITATNDDTPPPSSGVISIPTFINGTVPGLGSFTDRIELGESIVFYFNKISPSDTFLDFAVQARTPGWLGIGFSRNDNFQMRGSDAFIGYVSTIEPASTFLQTYLLATKDLDTTGIVPNPVLSIVSASASFFDGITTLVIRRNLLDGYNPIFVDTNGQMNAMIIASYSLDTTNPGVNYKHDVRVDFGRYVNLRTGQYDVAYRYPIPIRVAHGILMGTAYTLLFPLGLMIARYGKSETGTWFKAHFFFKIMHLLSCLLVLLLDTLYLKFSLLVLPIMLSWELLSLYLLLFKLLWAMQGLTRKKESRFQLQDDSLNLFIIGLVDLYVLWPSPKLLLGLEN
jgi:hypothetical protein